MGEGSLGWQIGLLFFALKAWPALSAIGVLLLALAWFTPKAPRAVRGVLALAALAFLGPVAVALGLTTSEAWSSFSRRRAEAAVTTVLPAPATVDGLALPAGVVIRWEDATRRRVAGVDLPRPRGLAGGPDGQSTASALGLAGVYFLRRQGESQGEDRWQAGVEQDQDIDGWPCAAPHVLVSSAGRLRACRLSRPFAWQGWTLPAQTEVGWRGDRLSLTVPEATPLEGPDGIGRLPWGVEMHPDGSLAAARFPRDRPLQVPGGQALWGDVRFRHDAQARRLLSVSGFAPADAASDGWNGQRLVVPWPRAR